MRDFTQQTIVKNLADYIATILKENGLEVKCMDSIGSDNWVSVEGTERKLYSGFKISDGYLISGKSDGEIRISHSRLETKPEKNLLEQKSDKFKERWKKFKKIRNAVLSLSKNPLYPIKYCALPYCGGLYK